MVIRSRYHGWYETLPRSTCTDFTAKERVPIQQYQTRACISFILTMDIDEQWVKS